MGIIMPVWACADQAFMPACKAKAASRHVLCCKVVWGKIFINGVHPLAAYALHVGYDLSGFVEVVCGSPLVG